MDFSNRQNRFVRLTDVTTNYLQEIEAKTKGDPYYPSYHIAPHHGLLNDPNGLSHLNGRHHIFYQWFPLGPVHGLKHWYHVSTEDFVHYEDHGIAMTPGDVYDAHGCFSGSALKKDEAVHLYYTGNVMKPDGLPYQSQVHAIMHEDFTVEKIDLVVDGPPDGFTHNFRDPVVWKKEDTYYMLVGGETADHVGAIALYESSDAHQFSYKGIIKTSFKELGSMWECPNYFEEGGQGIFLFSPQGIEYKDKYTFNNIFSVVYAIGSPIDPDKVSFDATQYRELDKGFDFYAPQTYQDDQGRRIMIGWLGNSKSTYPTDENMWAHMLTIPREVVVNDEILYQKPLSELQELRKEEILLKEDQPLSNKAFEIDLKASSSFQITLLNEEGDSVVFASDGEEYWLDRSHMSDLYAMDYGTVRYALRRVKEAHHIRMFIDHSSLEIFCDHGETVFTSRIFIRDLNRLKVTGGSGSLYYLNGNMYTP
ncbi:sucrose-6-phosphate hydrolase [Pontibacillus salipaludis]|uniref:glycoside hydrolase family 32 protein n=1 Tax=Pontibacillus salipaludis TaxID=1697394 RepID=UPI0031E70102